MKYDFGNMSAQNLRDLAGDFNAAANIADQITKIFGKDVRIDGTSSPTLGLPIFSAMKQAVRDADGLDLVLNELEVFIDKRDDLAPPAAPAPALAASVHPSAWTAEEDQILLNMLHANPRAANIRIGPIAAKYLPHRTAKSCEHRLGATPLRKRVAEIRRDFVALDLDQMRVPSIVPAQPVTPDSLTYDERELYRYLIDLTATGPTPNFDVPMIEAVGRGIALDAFSASAGLPHGIVTQRFNKLVAPLRNNCGQLPTHAMGCILKILKMIKGAAS